MKHDTESRTTTQDIAIRALGSGKVHFARVDERMLYPATQWGAEYTAVTPPIVVRCGVVLKTRPLVKIPGGESLDSWRRQKSVCRACDFIVGNEARDGSHR